MTRRATPFLLLALPLAFFLALFHPATLDPTNAGWLIRGTDNGENALGAHAYWHDPAAGASLTTHLLNAPDGVPLLYTDSNPLLTLLAKPVAATLSPDLQLIGPFVLFSLMLQAFFAWLLLRRHAPGPGALWIGVALLAFPPTLANRHIHVNLMAHWTILAALWLALEPVRGRRVAWWATLITITGLIHATLLFLVGAIWAATLLARVVEGDTRARLRVLGEGAAMLLLVAVLARWLGVGDQVTTNTFGRFSMPIDALWNPGVAAYSLLLPGHEASPGRGFEGFQYMGAGGLLLVLAALGIAWRGPVASPAQREATARLRVLLPALAVLTILAVAQLPLPPGVLKLLDPIRASGRLFWPVGYAIVLAALLALYRLPARAAGGVLALILAVQLFDLSGMAAAIRGDSAEAAAHRLYARTLDPRWDALVRGARSVSFMPGDDVTRDLALFQEVSWRASSARVPVTNVYAARTSLASWLRLKQERADFARGALAPGRLYVLQAAMPLPPHARAVVLDGVTLVTAAP